MKSKKKALEQVSDYNNMSPVYSRTLLIRTFQLSEHHLVKSKRLHTVFVFVKYAVYHTFYTIGLYIQVCLISQSWDNVRQDLRKGIPVILLIL
jgi:hypothetical protein